MKNSASSAAPDDRTPPSGLDAGVLRAPVGPPSSSNAMDGIPSTADARLSPSMSGAADLSSDAGMEHPAAGESSGWSMHDDLHYQQFRREHERKLDDEYRAWRRSRAASGQQRDSATPADEPRDEGPLQSLGRAVSETVTAAVNRDDGPPDHGGH